MHFFSLTLASPRRPVRVLCIVYHFVPYALQNLGPYTVCHPAPCTVYHLAPSLSCTTLYRVAYTVYHVPPCTVHLLPRMVCSYRFCIMYQLFWSLLKIQSPPQLEVVLRHIRIVTERYSQLDRWRYPQPPVKVRVHAPAGATLSLHCCCFFFFLFVLVLVRVLFLVWFLFFFSFCFIPLAHVLRHF